MRQVLDQELLRTINLREAAARQARFQAGHLPGHIQSQPRATTLPNSKQTTNELRAIGSDVAVKRDFFGRIIAAKPLAELEGNAAEKTQNKEDIKVWVTFHEGLNNAVRKPLMLQEFLHGL